MEQIKEIPKEMLTPRERSVLYGMGKEVDHIPYSLIGTEAAAELYGVDIRKTYTDIETVIALEKKMVDDFGIGCMSIGPRLKGIAEALGASMKYPKNNMYLIEEPLIADYKMLENMQVINPYTDGKMPIMLKMMEQLQKQFGDYDILKSGVCGPMTCALSLREAGMFLRDLKKQPEEMHHLLQFSLECIKAWMKVVYDEFGCVCSIADPASSMNLIGKKHFENFSKPYLKELVVWAKSYMGKSPSIHICGKSRKVWDDLKEIGFSAFSVDNCEDLFELKLHLGGEMAISGNVPPVDVLKNGILIFAEFTKCLFPSDER